MSIMKAIEFITVVWTLLYCATAVRGAGPSCSGAVEAVTSAASVEVAAEVVFASMSSPNASGVCGLELSCCTMDAERVLRADVTQVYQDSVRQLLKATIPGCMNSTLPGDSISFLEAVKSSVVSTMEYLWEDNYLPEFDTVFDSLFNYMENGILRRDLCDLEREYRSAFFEAYLLGFKSVLEYADKSTTSLSEDNFRDCFYGYFLEVHGATISDLYHNLMQRYNMLLRYLQALDTSDQALKGVLNHALSPECQDSLLRMTHCAQCAGVSDPSILPCKSLCQNVQQGCLVDIYELGYMYKELYDVLDDARDVLTEYNPLAQMQSLAAEVLKMLDDFKDGYELVANIVGPRCGVSFSARKRSVPAAQAVTRQHLKKTRRQAADPLDTLDDTVACARSVYRLLQQISTRTCGAHTIASNNEQCWNGTGVGNYNTVVGDRDRFSQKENPEIELTSVTGLLYLDAIAQLKNTTEELSDCTYNVESCAIKLCNRTVPSPSDYNLATDARYAPFTFSTEDISATSVISRTSAVVVKSSITVLSSYPSESSAVVVKSSITVLPSYPSESSAITYFSSTTDRDIVKTSSAVVERTFVLAPSVTLEVSASPEELGSGDFNGSAATYISWTLLITSLLLTVLL